ncbi:hypothetical protein BGZ83_005219 [Gryganskiella cystojenkinii]|nr:hypothetical protein BGZ83_005219 [Gryganskiella cystojenkinii]
MADTTAASTPSITEPIAAADEQEYSEEEEYEQDDEQDDYNGAYVFYGWYPDGEDEFDHNASNHFKRRFEGPMTDPTKRPFPRPWNKGEVHQCGFPPTLLVELLMRAVSNAIREKHQWWRKIRDPTIVGNWKKELWNYGVFLFDVEYNDDGKVIQDGANTDNCGTADSETLVWKQSDYQYRSRLREDIHFDFVIQELEWYADQVQEQLDRGIETTMQFGIDGTRRTDGLIPPELKQRFQDCVRSLMDVPDHLKDWHPGSNKQVLDLVHPSLFPVIVGRTRVIDITYVDEGKEQEANTETHTHADVACAKKTATSSPITLARALSSVGAGKVLESFAGAEKIRRDPSRPWSWDDNDWSTPVSDRCSSSLYQWLPTDFEVSAEGKVKILSYINNLHPVQHAEMYPVLEEIFELFVPMFEQVLAEMQNIWKKKPRLTADCARWYNNGQKFNGERHTNQFLDPIKVPERFTPPLPLMPFDLKNRDRPLQVIVKLANIELTPENPKYVGGAWHVEGMANESIVATGIYYHHSENITETKLNFRVNVREPAYHQGDLRGVGENYGIWDEGPMIQSLDGILTKQDRCIVFPNIYQHQVQPFELQDNTKPGSRRILVFFLIDPQHPILSTSQVPPQQKSWTREHGLLEEVSKRLPQELVDQVDEYLDWPMSLIEAKQHREKLMHERKFFVKTVNTELFERPFSLCEH